MIRVSFYETIEISPNRYVSPYTFHWFEEADLQGIRYIRATPDKSRVGSRLARWFRFFGYKPCRNCKCHWTQEMLDRAGLEYIEHEQEAIAKLICTNAKEIGKSVSLSVVKKILSAAIRIERRRANR